MKSNNFDYKIYKIKLHYSQEKNDHLLLCFISLFFLQMVKNTDQSNQLSQSPVKKGQPLTVGTVWIISIILYHS